MKGLDAVVTHVDELADQLQRQVCAASARGCMELALLALPRFRRGTVPEDMPMSREHRTPMTLLLCTSMLRIRLPVFGWSRGAHSSASVNEPLPSSALACRVATT